MELKKRRSFITRLSPFGCQAHSATNNALLHQTHRIDAIYKQYYWNQASIVNRLID